MIIRLGSVLINQLKISIGNVLIYARGRFTREVQPTTPTNAYYLQPDVNGNFTKAMVEDAVALGETYIVFDAATLDVNYADYVGAYMALDGVKGTALNPVTLDFTNVSINCYPDANDILNSFKVFILENCEHVIVKFGAVEGDKFKRAFATQEEILHENTYLVTSGKGCKSVTVDGGNAAGFMGDMLQSIVYGSQHIDTDPEGNYYYLQGDGRYESIFYNIDPTLYDNFGLTGGLGFNRLLYYDMEDVTFKFYDASENFISEITGAQYYGTYNFPGTARKMKVNVRPMDGRNESPTNFGHMLQYNPNSGTAVKNMTIADNHRGGISNIGANTLIDNCVFENTARYDTVPEFADSTIYHINCEDAVSRNLTISNCSFSNKFHKLLLTHNISVNIEDNTFTADDYSIFVYDLLEGVVSGNDFAGGIVQLGNGTNKGTVIVQGNTGSPDILLSNGAEWKNNNFTGAQISGLGKLNNNTLTNTGLSGIIWTKQVHSNTFIGDGGDHYTYEDAYIYNNTFINDSFRFQHSGNSIYFDGVTIDNTTNPTLYGFNRTYGNNTIVAVNCVFKNLRIATDNTAGNYYFEGCTFQDISSHIAQLNASTGTPINFYFKNCTFIGSGNFVSGASTNSNYNMIFDNCTIDNNLVLPTNYTNATVTIPALVEPRTQPVPDITYNVDRVQVYTEYHIMNLQIRNKNTQEVILNEDVCSTYNHFTATPNDFEYSIDGGVYWDSLSI